jgi:hypothetical protein
MTILRSLWLQKKGRLHRIFLQTAGHSGSPCGQVLSSIFGRQHLNAHDRHSASRYAYHWMHWKTARMLHVQLRVTSKFV